MPIGATGCFDDVTRTDGRRVPAEPMLLAERYVALMGSQIQPFEVGMAASSDPKVEAQPRMLADQDPGAGSR